MRDFVIGIDNGIGTMGIIGKNGFYNFEETPTMSQQDYTKKKKNITRIDSVEMAKKLSMWIDACGGTNGIVLIERPMVNPQRFLATASALRAHEAILTVVERMGLPHMFIDSKEWQKILLPAGCQKEELKKASLDIGNRLFPLLIKSSAKDRDGILIAEYGRRINV